jgi:Zinc-binding dehydrogenase
MCAIPRHDRKMMGYFRELIETGEFKPVIDRTHPLDRIVEAYRYVESDRRSEVPSSPSMIPLSARPPRPVTGIAGNKPNCAARQARARPGLVLRRSRRSEE